MPNDLVRYSRYRFPPDIISHAVWLYYDHAQCAPWSALT
jgi:hypothetical protein